MNRKLLEYIMKELNDLILLHRTELELDVSEWIKIVEKLNEIEQILKLEKDEL